VTEAEEEEVATAVVEEVQATEAVEMASGTAEAGHTIATAVVDMAEAGEEDTEEEVAAEATVEAAVEAPAPEAGGTTAIASTRRIPSYTGGSRSLWWLL